MIKGGILFLFLLIVSIGYSQQEQFGYLVEFTDKTGTNYTIDNPEVFLSERAIQRRLKSQIQITDTDFPVSKIYIDSLITFGAVFHNSSKWLNSAVFLTSSSSFVLAAENCSFVKKVSLVYEGSRKKSTISEAKLGFMDSPKANIWGEAFFQLDRCNATFLHEMGFFGQGIQVAVLDGGFSNVDINHGFDSLFLNNRIVGTYDFVDNNQHVYEDHLHGANVLSIIAGNIPGEYLGAGPRASFWLLRTENVNTEYLIEEENWISAAEFADSAGCDIITASLGYSVFDNALMNHVYSELDGETLRISRAAEIAFSKGMLVVNSAGNSGSETDPWYYITAPSDALHVLSIGAIDSEDNLAGFSSKGPSADGRIKPDLVAQGVKTKYINIEGLVTEGNGTSYSSPLITGMAASLWSAFPEKSNIEIYEAIKYSGHQFLNPDNQKGFGIPDFEKAYYRLTQSKTSDVTNAWMITFPNPFEQELTIELKNIGNTTITIELFRLDGIKVYSKNQQLSDNNYHRLALGTLQNLGRGMYFLSITNNEKRQTTQIVKL